MIVATVTDITTATVETLVDSVDDPLSDDAVKVPEAGATVFMQNLLFIFSSFQLTAALANSISVLADAHKHHDDQIGQILKFFAYSLFFISSPLDFLDIDLGCVPVSVDAAVRQLSWSNWVVLLPEIPSNSRF
ncbi:MAG: hypothetical protein AAGA83_24800 [Cyanobacteria bacterium P01_F01_bin.116]